MITPFSRFREKEDIVSLLDDDNKLVIPICQNILFLANKMLDPESDSFLAFNKEQAPIVGLYHKQVRYFKYYVEAYQAGNADLCFLLNRIIYEAYIKMRYLMDYPYDVKEYRALSFKPHINILDNQKLSRTPHTQVLKRKFKSALEMEDLTIDDIKNARRCPGGKNFKQMHELYENKDLYSPIYSMSSDSIHSGWNEIRQLYLRCDKENKQYVADVDFHAVLHFRVLITVADILIDSSIHYYKWLVVQFPGMLPGILQLWREFKRMCRLISEVVIDTYKNNPDEYLYK